MTRKLSEVHSFILAFPIKPVRLLRPIPRLIPTTTAATADATTTTPASMSGPTRSTRSNSTTAMAADDGVNIVVDITIAIIVGIVVVVVGLVTRVSRSSLLLFHSHDSVVRHHGRTSSFVHSIPKSS